MHKIHVILGTKAQLIKMAPILAQFQRRGLPFNFILTGQHKETLDALRENFGIKAPDCVLYAGPDITGTLKMITWLFRSMVKMLWHRRRIFGAPLDAGHVVMVHGDTVSTLLGAVVGRLLGAKVAHVESGLRSFNYLHPFPEEITRVLTFLLTDYFYCPGDWAVGNLKRFRGEKINTGQNTLFDCLQLAKSRIQALPEDDLPERPYVVCTLHRFENLYHKRRVQWIVSTLERLSRQWKILFVMHSITGKQLRKWDCLRALEQNPRIELLPRMDYFQFIRLVYHAAFVISDGGSNQEENYYLGKPCLLFRKAVERREGIGENCIVSGYDDRLIDRFAQHPEEYERPPVELEVSPTAVIVNHIQSALWPGACVTGDGGPGRGPTGDEDLTLGKGRDR
ncbi:MAG TPA: UDP-N-acetylglucosamine 2-epimerase [Gammaproteobacteria bacterium]|nr:UDP-N-acetylglucosamine 2-epimerase [Gammaproteobacteria bacterium]